MSDDIILECACCGRTMPYARNIDPAVPLVVAKILHGRCDKCDNGDFGSEAWFDADGNEISLREYFEREDA